GIGDILYGTRYAIDKAAMRNIAPLARRGQIRRHRRLGQRGGL
ncbi:TPA: MafB family polymorphic toxin, partial [Neisseria meningitidis]